MRKLHLYLDRIEAKAAALSFPDGPVRAIYVIDGALALLDGAGTVGTLSANSAAHRASGWRIAGGHVATRALRWELVASSAEPVLHSAAGFSSSLLLSAPLSLKPETQYLLRCDRVDFPPGGEAFLHTHQGSGTRCLLSGSIRIDTQGAKHTYLPLQAWFEAGPDPVHATTDPAQASAFVRTTVLPRSLLGGKSSIQYVRAEDLDRPKTQRYQLFIDAPIELPPLA